MPLLWAWACISALRPFSTRTRKSSYFASFSLRQMSQPGADPLTDDVVYRHLSVKDPLGRDVVGLYPTLSDKTCYLLVLDFEREEW